MKTNQFGLSLIEVLVALMLMSVVGGALYDLLNNQWAQLRHLSDVQRRLQQQHFLLEWLKILNPAIHLQGEQSLPPYTIQWHSLKLTKQQGVPVTAEYDEAMVSNYFQTDLFQVEASLWLQGQLLVKTTIIQVGFVPMSHGKALPFF